MMNKPFDGFMRTECFIAQRFAAFLGCVFIALFPIIVMGQTSDDESTEPEDVLVRGSIVSDEAASKAVFRRSLNQDDIAELNAPDLSTLLRTLPGIDTARQGGPGGLVYVTIRGGDPNFTVVLIDGVQVDDPTNSRGGGFDFSGLDPLMIESVDVFYGSYSAVFGSSALGGVISITTRTGAGAQAMSATLEVGTSDALAGTVLLAGDLGEAVNVGISASARDGGDAVEGDSMDLKQLTVHLGSSKSSSSDFDWKINLFASDTDATSFPTASGGQRLAVLRDTESRQSEQRNIGTGLSWKPASIWHLELNANHADYQEDNFSPAIVPGVLSGVPPVETHSQYKRSNVSILNTLFATEQTTLGFGAELVDEKGEINSIIDFGFPLPADFTMNRDTWAVFGEASYSAEYYTILGSVRHDDIDTTSSTNVRLATEFDIQSADTRVWLSYSEGFKMPSMFALGHSLTGNPDLVPEESTSYSGTVEKLFTQQDASISLTVFKNTFKNLVDFDAATFLHVNRDSAKTKGVELNGRADLSSTLSLSAYVAYLETSVSDGSKLEHRPKWKTGLDLSWRWSDDLLFNLSGYGNDGAYSLSVPTGLTELDGYVRVDAGVQWQFNKEFVLKFQVDNLFDSDYEEVVGFSPGGRQGRIALTATL